VVLKIILIFIELVRGSFLEEQTFASAGNWMAMVDSIIIISLCIYGSVRSTSIAASYKFSSFSNSAYHLIEELVRKKMLITSRSI
jgi:hypothetical protein